MKVSATATLLPEAAAANLWLLTAKIPGMTPAGQQWVRAAQPTTFRDLAAAFCVLPLVSLANAGEVSPTERLEILQEVYRKQIAGISEKHVRMADGREIEIDDGRRKSHADKLANADIEDMLSQVYPVIGCLPPGAALPVDFDPGRIRNESFFKSIYGASKEEVTAKIAWVDWYGQKLAVNRTLEVDKKLEAVKNDLTPSLSSIGTYLKPSAGTFNWRTIAGTSQMSTHSYAIAIDIASDKADYWRWSKPRPGMTAEVRKKIPEQIVAAFERHGFIWGGNWYHFDTMHFEYRPELIAIGMLAKKRGCSAL